MAARISVPLDSAADLALLAEHAERHGADPAARLLVIGPDGATVPLPAGARLAVPVVLRVTREAPTRRPVRRQSLRPVKR